MCGILCRTQSASRSAFWSFHSLSLIHILLPYKNQPVVMLVVNFIPMLLGYLLKVIMFRHRGFGNDYALSLIHI